MVTKIKAENLKRFLKKTTANATIEDCKLKFTVDGLEMQHKNMQGTIFIKGVLPKTSFDEYETMEINIKNTETLLKVLDTFGDNIINIVKENDMIRIMDSNGGIDLSVAEAIECYKETAPELEYTNAFVMKKSMIDTIVKRNSIIKSDEITMELKDKKVKLDIGDRIDKANVYENVTSEEEVKATFEFALFDKLTSQMDILLDVSLSNDKPTRFTENSEDYSIEYYLINIDEE